MDVSKFLGKVLGLYLIIVSVAMFLNRHYFITSVEHLMGDEPLLFVTGFFTLILGILMVVSHNIWEWNWRVIITLIAWIVLLKGISLILYPQLIDRPALLFIHHLDMTFIGAGFDFVIGVLLTYYGCKR